MRPLSRAKAPGLPREWPPFDRGDLGRAEMAVRFVGVPEVVPEYQSALRPGTLKNLSRPMMRERLKTCPKT